MPLEVGTVNIPEHAEAQSPLAPLVYASIRTEGKVLIHVAALYKHAVE